MANTLTGLTVGFLVGKLSAGELQKIEGCFAEAIAWDRRPDAERAAIERGRIRKTIASAKQGARKSKDKAKHVFKRKDPEPHPIRGASEEQAARGVVAGELTSAWKAASMKPDNTETWIAILEASVREAATTAVAGEGERRYEWRYALGVEGREPIAEEIEDWAFRISRRVLYLWRRDEALSGLVKQLNSESALGLQEVLLETTKEISQNLQKIAMTTSAVLLAGGGGTALLVLFIDKG